MYSIINVVVFLCCFLQRTQSEFYVRILHEHRAVPTYFRVGFYGAAFPSFLRVILYVNPSSMFFSVLVTLLCPSQVIRNSATDEQTHKLAALDEIRMSRNRHLRTHLFLVFYSYWQTADIYTAEACSESCETLMS